MKILFLTISLFFLGTAYALDLDSAKTAGFIGEQVNGYLGIVAKPASSEVETLVKDINSKRKQKYQEIASQNGIELEVVEKQSGAILLEKTESGNYINAGTGWQKK